MLEVDKVTEGYKEKMAAFFKVRKHVIMTAVLTSVALIVAIVAIAVGVNINKTPHTLLFLLSLCLLSQSHSYLLY